MILLHRRKSFRFAVVVGLWSGFAAGPDVVAQIDSPHSSGAINAASPSNDPPGLAAEHIYNGINRPCIVIVTSPRSIGTISLALMDNDGNPLAPAAEVHPGRIDLVD